MTKQNSNDKIEKVDFSKQPFTLTTKNGKILQAKSVIIATGASPKKLKIPGEDKYWGKGVNVCATCDAPLYAEKEIIVVGGGNSAIAESYALSKHVKKITIIQISDKLSATDPLKEEVLQNPKVDVLYNTAVKEIKGDGQKVTSVILEDQKNKTTFDYSTEGVFIAIGHEPNSSPFEKQLKIDDRGYIIRQEGYKTSAQGVFVAGDVTDSKYRQAITAAGQGCAAALECEKFLTMVTMLLV